MRWIHVCPFLSLFVIYKRKCRLLGIGVYVRWFPLLYVCKLLVWILCRVLWMWPLICLQSSCGLLMADNCNSFKNWNRRGYDSHTMWLYECKSVFLDLSMCKERHECEKGRRKKNKLDRNPELWAVSLKNVMLEWCALGICGTSASA